jgi:hypothetical protein
MWSVDHILVVPHRASLYGRLTVSRSENVKLGHLLYLSGMNREAYNTLARRGHLDFLKENGLAGVDRFNHAHALAITAFTYLRRIGLEPSTIALAITESWWEIKRVVGLDAEPIKTGLCGVRINNLGITDTWGWRHPNGRDVEPIASASVNLVTLWKWMQPGLRELEEA